MESGFIRADKLFEYAAITYYAGRGRHRSIFVRCPKCGKIGRLIVIDRSSVANHYRVVHGKYVRRGCNFGYTTPGWDYLNDLYKRYKHE